MEIGIRLTGTTPLIMCKFTDAAALRATSGTSSSLAAQDRGTPEQEATKYLYVGLDDKPMIPQPMLFRAIVDGGQFHKAGRSKITTQKTSLLYACLDIPQSELKLESKGGWSVDTRAVRIPATGGRILCHRPIFHDWSVSFECVLDETLLSPSLLRHIIDDAGRRVGIGAFRPGCKGPYGKFRVDEWKVTTQQFAEAAE